MTILEQLLIEVRDENLSQDHLERLQDRLVHIYSDVLKERAEKRKKKALFMIKSHEQSIAAKKLEWDVSPDGQRLFELDAYASSIKAEVKSLGDRIWRTLRIS